MTATPFFDEFADSLAGPDAIERLRAGLIGEGLAIDGPLGPHPMIYADYIASGRALRQIEERILERVLPFYANSHTDGSYCGAFVTGLRQQARTVIARACGADDERFATVFTGPGATAGLNRLVALLGLPEAVAAGRRPLVLVGPYEHHSNLLPWRDSGAEVVELDEAPQGGPDLDALEAALRAAAGRPVIGAFSAASNISGILTDTVAVSRLLKRHGALSVWDYAGGAPYLAIDMAAGTDHEKDAVVFSPHKFVGGPGASGVLIVRRDAVTRKSPVWPGGGTVAFVSPWAHDYVSSLEEREEAGTPNVLGDIRAAMVFTVKAAMGQDWLDRRHRDLRRAALAVLDAVPGLHYAAKGTAAPALPFFSLWLEGDAGKAMPYTLMTRVLSDCFGIQTRGGCACAGPYGHRLFGIDRQRSEVIRAEILAGDMTDRPGFTRFNLSALMTDAKVAAILAAIREIAEHPARYAGHYAVDPHSGSVAPAAPGMAC